VSLHPASVLKCLDHCGVVRMLTDLCFKVLVLATKRLARDVVLVKLLDFFVIEAEPRIVVVQALAILDVAVVMPRLSRARVHHNSLEFEVVIRLCNLAVQNDLLLFCKILQSQALLLHLLKQFIARYHFLTVRAHIKLHREAAVIIDFEFRHRVIVEFEAAKHEEEHVRESFDRVALQCVPLAFTAVTEVSVVALEHVAADVGLKRLLYRLLVLDHKLDVLEWFFALALVWTVFADDFVDECSVEQIFHDLFLLRVLGERLDFVNERVEEFVGVFLDCWVNRASVNVFECLHELLWVVVLLLEVHEAAENALDLIEHVFARGFVLLVLNFKDSLPERWDHVKLLHNRVHVADATYVLQTNESSCRLLELQVRRHPPILLTLRSPAEAGVFAVDCAVQEFDKDDVALLVVDQKLLHQVHTSISCVLRLALGALLVAFNLTSLA